MAYLLIDSPFSSYLNQESRDKRGSDFNLDEWKAVNRKVSFGSSLFSFSGSHHATPL